MKKLFNKIDDLQRKINAVQPVDSALQAVLYEKLRVEWTYNSNAIEGNTLSFGETAFFLQAGLTSEGRPLKDYLEAKNHAEAIDGLQDIIAGKRPLSESLIKELHAVLLKGIASTPALGPKGQQIQKTVSPGQYKTQPNHVLTLSGKIHHYTEPWHVNDEMEQLLSWYHETTMLHPVEKSALFHYRFVNIHPFDDGNGRLARILMNLILMKAHYPPCIIQMQHRKKYLECLAIADTGETSPFVTFIAEELQQTQQTILSVLHGEDIGLPETALTLNPTERTQLILKVLTAGPASIGQIHRACPQIKRSTLKSDLQRLLATKEITKSGQGKGVVYAVGGENNIVEI